jgi:hypothetical protein
MSKPEAMAWDEMDIGGLLRLGVRRRSQLADSPARGSQHLSLAWMPEQVLFDEQG